MDILYDVKVHKEYAHCVRRGVRQAAKRAPEHFLPRVGDIILFNENIEQMERRSGFYGKTSRGIARVLAYNGSNHNVMHVEIYRRPGYNQLSNFSGFDFLTGLYTYRKLSDYVYTDGKYGFEDLDLLHPHEDILRLFADDGDYHIPESQQVFARYVK